LLILLIIVSILNSVLLMSSQKRNENLEANIFSSLEGSLNDQFSADKNTKISDFEEAETLEEYLRQKFPEDWEMRLEGIDRDMDLLLERYGVDLDTTDRGILTFFRKLGCWLSGGQFYDLGYAEGCVKMTDFDRGNILSSSDTPLSLDLNQDTKNVSEFLSFSNLSNDIETTLINYGVDSDFIETGAFRRFFCKLFGGHWASDTYDIDGVNVTVEGCFWLADWTGLIK